MKSFVIDIAKCNGCYCCQIACKDEHVGNDWSPYAKPQPDTGQFWLKLNEFVRGTVPKVKVAYRPVLCMHCADAPCMAACTVEGAISRRDDGLVIINPEKCTGCRSCVDRCPYGVIYFNEDLNIAQKCTGCAHLLDSGWKEPRCVDACPTEALRFADEADMCDAISQAEVLHPEYKTNPRVFYLNLPGKFIAGTIYDPEEKEVIINATCTLNDESSKKQRTVVTDGFGDFWFEGLEEGKFSLKIEADGFDTHVIGSINTEQDVNLGDLGLSRKM